MNVNSCRPSSKLRALLLVQAQPAGQQLWPCVSHCIAWSGETHIFLADSLATESRGDASGLAPQPDCSTSAASQSECYSVAPVARSSKGKAASSTGRQAWGSSSSSGSSHARGQAAPPVQVPALLLGDVFMTCNTLSGILSTVPDMDLGDGLQPLPGSRYRGGRPGSTSATSHQLPIDAATRLLVQMAVPLEGRRLFFVSRDSAEMIRQALVLERYEEIMERRQQSKVQEQGMQGPMGPLAAVMDMAGRLRDWAWDQLSDDQQEGIVLKTRHSESLRRSSHPLGRSSNNRAHWMTLPGSAGGLLGGLGLPRSVFLGASRSDATSQGPHQLGTLVSELKRLDEESVVLEAGHILGREQRQQTEEEAPWWRRLLPGPAAAQQGKQEEQAGGPPSSSYVARLPLEPALQLLMHKGEFFSLAATGGDAKAVAMAAGRSASLDLLRASPSGWELQLGGPRQHPSSSTGAAQNAAGGTAGVPGGGAAGDTELAREAGSSGGAEHAGERGTAVTGLQPRMSAVVGGDSAHQASSGLSSRAHLTDLAAAEMRGSEDEEGASAALSDGRREASFAPSSPSLIHPLVPSVRQRQRQADAHGSETDTDEESLDDDDVALIDRTPVFRLPGVTLTLQSTGQPPLRLSPAFLSMGQLVRAIDEGRRMAGAMWLAQRRAHRQRWRGGVETAALLVSGLAPGLAGAISSSGPAGRDTGEAEEDEDGHADPPEARQLLQELGEGNGGRRAAVSAPALEPPGGLLSVLNTAAVGVVSLAGHAFCSAADWLDWVALASPFAPALLQLPKSLNLQPTYLDDWVQELSSSTRHLQQQEQQQQQQQGAAAAAAAVGPSPPTPASQSPGAAPGLAEPPASSSGQAESLVVSSSDTAAQRTKHEQEPIQQQQHGNAESTYAASQPLHSEARSPHQQPAPAAAATADTSLGHSNQGSAAMPMMPARHSKQQQQQQQWDAVSHAAAAGGASLQPEVMAALSVLLYGAWMALQELREGDEQLAAGLAEQLLSSKVSRLGAQEFGVDVTVDLASVKALTPWGRGHLPGHVPRRAGRTQQHKHKQVTDHSVQIGLHVDMGKLTGSVAEGAPGVLATESNKGAPTAGILLIGDLCLDEEGEGTDAIVARYHPPSLGFADLAKLASSRKP